MSAAKKFVLLISKIDTCLFILACVLKNIISRTMPVFTCGVCAACDVLYSVQCSAGVRMRTTVITTIAVITSQVQQIFQICFLLCDLQHDCSN